MWVWSCAYVGVVLWKKSHSSHPFRYLCTRFSGSDVINLQHFLLEWQVGVWWKWAGQMSSQVDRDRYWEVVSHALKKFFNQDKVVSLQQ